MAVVYRYIEILTVGVVVFFRSPSVFHSQDSFPSTFRPRLLETSSGVVAVGVFAVEEDAGTSEKDEHRKPGFQHIDHGHLARNCSIRLG